MNPQRRTAVSLMIILTVFSLLVAARLVAIDRHETRAGVLAETELTRLKEAVKDDPKNEAAIQQIRQQDLRVREEYFRDRRQFAVAGYMLVAALIGFMMCVRIFVNAQPLPEPDIEALNRGVPREVLDARARRGAIAVGAVVGLSLLWLAASGIAHRASLPPYEKVVAQLKAAAPTTATLAQATPAPQPESTPAKVAASATATPASTATPAQTATPAATPQPATHPTPAPVAATPAPVANVNFKQNWPNFRGPGNLGLAGPGNWPTTWNAKTGANIAWKTEIPAVGNSSPILWGDKIFLTGGDKTAHHVICFDRASGKLLWNTTLQPPADAAEMDIFEDTGFAAPTPATDGQRVYAMFASGLLAAVDFSGKQVWSKVYEKPDSQYGLASSLIMHEGTLIVLLDQGADAEAKKSRLIGLDPATGNEKWSTPRPVPASWASPAIIKTASRYELVACANPLVFGYDPATGKELWKMDGYGGEIAPSPAFDGERIILSNDGAATFAIKPGLSGDITQSGVAWKNEEGGCPDIASPLGDGKHVLLVAGSGMLTCLNAADGTKAWEKSLETSFSASPILAGKYVYLCGQDGIARVIEMGAEYKLVAQNDCGEQVHLTPAFGDGQIVIRGPKHLICISSGSAVQSPSPSPSPSPSQSHSDVALTSQSRSQSQSIPTAPSARTTTSTASATPSAKAAASTSPTQAASVPAPAPVAAPASAAPAQPGAYKQNWPNLRGPGNLGIAAAGDYPTGWDAAKNQNVPWKVEIPAAGKSSPIVWGDRIFLTGGDKDKYAVMCFDRASGKLLWNAPVTPSAAARDADIFEDTGVAASTPATDGQRVYAIFASGQLAAFDFSGKQVWLKDFGLPESQYGYASSLIMHEGTLIVLFDQGADAEAKMSRLIGLDPATGNEKWSTPRPVPASWASPAIIKTASRYELVACANPLVFGYDPASGKELWKMDGYGGEIAPSPAFDGERIILSNDGAATFAIKPGLSGDITQSGVVWKNEEGGCPDTASPLAFGKYALLAASSGMITCLGTADGKKVWEKSLECQFTASPILAGKFVYLCGQDGITRAIEPGDTFKLAGQGSVGEPIQVTPAFADGRIYIRGSKHLFCIGAKP